MRRIIVLRVKLAISVAVIGFACQLTTVSADIASGMKRLCVDHEPDAAAVVDSPDGNALLIFKELDLWATSLDNLILAILNPDRRRNSTFSQDNAIEAPQIFANFPRGPKRVVSFTKLNGSNSLQNNILVFHEEQQMTRYRVVHIDNLVQNSTSIRLDSNESGDQLARYKPSVARADTANYSRANIIATLESQHSTARWPWFPRHLYDIKLIYNVPNSRLLTSVANLKTQTGTGTKMVIQKMLWLLNRKNLDKPVGLMTPHALMQIAPHPFAGKSILFHHRMSNDQPNGQAILHFSILRGGLLCYELDCAPLDEFMDCDASTLHFTSGLAYWIQYQTQMTFRLLMSALVSALIISLSISLLFIYNQLKKVAELT